MTVQVKQDHEHRHIQESIRRTPRHEPIHTTFTISGQRYHNWIVNTGQPNDVLPTPQRPNPNKFHDSWLSAKEQEQDKQTWHFGKGKN